MADLTGKTVGNYEIIRVLGKGGMATVYLARQTNMKREVAVKVIESDLAQSAEFVRRFEREVDTIASFSNAHILKVFDYGKAEGMVYLVMELLRGGSLADKIRNGPLPLPTIRTLLSQIASALDYAHRRGIVHRDLKPQNVMLDEDGNAFLTDFGIAKVMSGGTTITMATSSGAILGTPAYMAPEQWKSQPVDARTDIYALGIMLYEMLTGALPFASDTAYGLMHKHVNEEPPIRTMDRRFVSGIERVLFKALAKNPDDRYSSSMQLVREFEAAIQQHGLTDAPYSDTSGQLADGVELIELEPLDIDEVYPNPLVDVDSEILQSITPTESASQQTSTASAKPNMITPLPAMPPAPPPVAPPPTASAATTPPAQSRTRLMVVGVIAAVLVIVAAGSILLGGRGGNATPTTPPTAVGALGITDSTTSAPTSTVAATDTATIAATATSSPTVTASSTITPSATATDEPNVQTQVALTLTDRATQTLLYEASYTKTPTPNRQQTTVAMIAQMDTETADTATANAIASFTKTPTPTLTATLTLTPTDTATATFTPTITKTATLTPTLTFTPVPCVLTTTETTVGVRLGPSRQRNAIGNLAPGENYIATQQAIDNVGDTWVRVMYRDQALWVLLSDVTSSGDCAKLPTFTATLAPTRTPTLTATITLTRTPTLTLTLTPSFTPPADAICVIMTTQTNIAARLGPSRQRSTSGFLNSNTPYAPANRVVENDENTWVQITLRGQQLWVLLSDVTVQQGDCNQLPVFVATLAPTRTPTITPTLTLTRTPTITLTYTPSITPPANAVCLIITSKTNVGARLGPSSQRNIVVNLSPNTLYAPSNQVDDSDGNTWVQITIRDQQLWVLLSDVTVQGDCSKLPVFVATIAPTRTPTVTLTYTPSITPPPNAICLIITSKTNVGARLGPSHQRNVLSNLSPNTLYAPSNRTDDNDGNTWVQITIRNQQAWVLLSDVTVQGDCSKLPAATTGTPSPTVQPSATTAKAASVVSVSDEETATPNADKGAACVIMAEETNTARIRLGPADNRAVMGYLSADTPYTAISRSVDANNKVWIEVKINTKQGWVLLDEVTAQGDCAQIPAPTATAK